MFQKIFCVILSLILVTVNGVVITRSMAKQMQPQTHVFENSSHKIIYYYEPRFTRYDENDRICTSKGMTLAFVRSASENNFIKSFRSDLVRLGAVKDPFNRRYEWSDGTEITYNNWSRDNFFLQGCCSVEMDEDGKWRKYRGDSSHLLCQKIVDKTTGDKETEIEQSIKNPTAEEEDDATNSTTTLTTTSTTTVQPVVFSSNASLTEKQIATAIEDAQRTVLATANEMFLNVTVENSLKLNEMNKSMIEMKSELEAKLSKSIKEIKDEYQLGLDKITDQVSNWSTLTSKSSNNFSQVVETKLNEKLRQELSDFELKNDRLMLHLKDEMSVIKESVKNLSLSVSSTTVTPATTTSTTPRVTTLPTRSTTMSKIKQEVKTMVAVDNTTARSEKLSQKPATSGDGHSDTVKMTSKIGHPAIDGTNVKSKFFTVLLTLALLGSVIIILYKKFVGYKIFGKRSQAEDSIIFLE